MPKNHQSLVTLLIVLFVLDVTLEGRAAPRPEGDTVIAAESQPDSTSSADKPSSSHHETAPSGLVRPAQYPATPTGMPPVSSSPGTTLSGGTPATKPAVQPWKLLFFENDFSYKNDEEHSHLLGEELKDIPLDDFDLLDFVPEPTRLSSGGELRFRLMDESNRLRPGKPSQETYQLWRWRQYVDLKVADWFRVYAEMIDASMDNNPLAPIPGEVNRWDALNLFFDLRLMEFDDDRPVWFRYGRQELSYGSQRLVSPLDWANIRRNFEGLKFFTSGSDWDFDLWFTRPVNSATIGDTPASYSANHFDSPNMNHTFSGAWFTYKGVKEQILDLYWLWDFNSKLIEPHFPGGNRHTVAGRWLRNLPEFEGNAPARTRHVEVEGGYQFGNDFGKNVVAGFVTAGAGYTWNTLPWTPNLWIYYDYASGSNNVNGATTNTFNQQYGLVHAFLGQIDNIARQNVSDVNTKVTVKPLQQLTFETQYHYINKANTHDFLYTISGLPFGKPNTGKNIGNEVDLLATWTINPNFNVQLGYFWFWYGPVVENVSPRGTADLLYLQTTLRY